jgi:hypothetical protein
MKSRFLLLIGTICIVFLLVGCVSGGTSSIPANPTITWSVPLAIAYGTALSPTQLDASAHYAGTFNDLPAPGTMLSAGTQTLTATFTPSDPMKVASATATNTLTVNKATPTLTWKTPAPIAVGAASSAAPLNATSSAAGVFVYSPAADTVMNTAGTQALVVSFTPTEMAGYNSAPGSGTLTVNAASAKAVAININTLANRHQISPYVYGGNISSSSTVSDSGTSLARWGGNASSTYNWQLHTYNADADYYFEDFNTGGSGAESDSVQFITDVKNAGSHPLTTMATLGWVTKAAENGSNGNWSFSVATYGAQCSVDQYNKDAGDGLKTDCKTPVTTSAATTAYYPLLDSSSQPCPSGNCVYREPWAQALATAFGSGTCVVPYTAITSCHFYDMDNEFEIWGGTHRDVHPAPSGYDELANMFESEAGSLKTWDPAAVRFGPVTCCWWYYWNGANGADRGNHGGVDYLPWWLNQVYWMDTINGARTLDVFDIHAYAEANTAGLTTAQLQALSASVYRDYWDPTYVSTSGTINQIHATSIEPNRTIPFRIPRMKALVNAIYPGTPLSFTEWSAAFYQESDFSTALGDAEAYGIFGREGLSFATRWGAPTKGNPNYQALKMYTNYDGAHHGFGTLSVSDLSNGNPNLFSSYAALNSSGTVMSIMVLNEDPANTVQVTFNLNGFSPTTYFAYTLSSTASGSIAASSSAAWNASRSFPPYSITLLAINGTEVSKPLSEWYLNPDDLMVPASGSSTLHPTIVSGITNVTLSSAVFDAYSDAPACSGGSLQLTNATITASQPGTITVNAGSTPGFCHYTVTGSDGTATQTQGGWIVVGNSPATLTQSGNNQSGSAGTALTQPLTVTLSPGQSGGTTSGAGILFTTSAGTLSNGTTSGTKVIAQTNSSGVASVTLTLPSAKGTVTVTAQDQFALGGTSVTFQETSN